MAKILVVDDDPGIASLLQLHLSEAGHQVVTALDGISGTTAALRENPELITGLLRFSCPFDMTGSPTITLPGGFTESGGPVAFQFVGRHFDEARLVAAGDAFQRVTDWHCRHPSL